MSQTLRSNRAGTGFRSLSYTSRLVERCVHDLRHIQKQNRSWGDMERILLVKTKT